MTEPHTINPSQLLKWYQAMGVSETVGDQPADWFARSKARQGKVEKYDSRILQKHPGEKRHDQKRTAQAPVPRRASTPAPPAQTRFSSELPSKALEDIRAKADQAPNLNALLELLGEFDGCPLKATAKNLCFSRGSARARLMLIGEAPGRDEDINGKPFVGRAGRLLDKMLAAINLGEDDVYITNVVYWRPPGNRTPTPQEVQACEPFLQRQIELIDPDILVFLGGAAAKQMFATSEGIMRQRGKWRTQEFGGKERRAIATLHPAYLLRTPAAKRLAWQDFLEIQAALAG